MQVRAGSRIQVRGGLRQDSWVDKHTGERQWMVKVVGASRVDMPESEGARACQPLPVPSFGCPLVTRPTAAKQHLRMDAPSADMLPPTTADCC